MSGSLLGGIAGAVLGSFIPGVGTAIGFALGSAAGSVLFPGSLPTQYGPRLEDLRPQTSEYGKPIPIVYGTVGMGGNVIWASDYVEVETKTEQGGKGGPSQTTITYSYFANFAVAFAEGECDIGNMWAGPSKRLVYDGALLEGSGSVRIYRGTEDQLPDPLIESYEGVGNVPAHRGICYAVFEMFPLENDGNAIPFITAQVGAKAGAHGQTPTYLGETVATPDFRPAMANVDPTTGWIWNVRPDGVEPAASYSVSVINDADKSPAAPVSSAPLALLGGYVVNVVPIGGLVYVVMAQFQGTSVAAGDYRKTNLALVDVYTAGSANPDGTTAEAPILTDSGAYGTPTLVQDTWFEPIPGGGTRELQEPQHYADPYGPPAPPLGPQPTGTRVEGVATINGVPQLEKPTYPTAAGTDGTRLWIAYNFSNASNAYVAAYTSARDYELEYIGPIGYPFQVLGDSEYMGVVGSGGSSYNFAILSSAAAPTLLYTMSIPSAGGGKAFDYDPKRQVFMAYTLNSMNWTAIDAATGAIEEHALTVGPGDTSPAPTPYITAVSYSARTDKYLFGASSGFAGTGTTIYVVNPDSLAVEGTYTFEEGGQLINPLLDPVTKQAGRPYILSFDQNNVKRLYLAGGAEPTPVGLGAIVADLSARAGLTETQYDVSALTDMVDGYAIARQTTVRAAIDALRPAYYFDAVESGGLVKFVKRGGQAVVDIDDDDLDAHQADGQPGDPLLTTRQMEVELPNAMNVNYLLAATDYEKATKLARRLVGASGEEATLDLPLVLSDTKAQEIAEVNLHAPWVQRIKYGPFTLPRKYSALEPTDIITVRGYEMMLEKVTASPGGVLTCEAVATDSSGYTPHVVVTETVPNEKLVYVPGETTLELM